MTPFSRSSTYRLTTSDRIFVLAPPTFDPFILDICLALHNGATAVLAPLATQLSPTEMDSIVRAARVTILQMTPSLFRRWNPAIDKIGSSLRCLIFGGEPIEAIDVERFAWQMKNLRIFNIYGCTEQSCWTTIHEVRRRDIECRKIPIGKPISKRTDSMYILSANRDNVGELCLVSTKRHCFERSAAPSPPADLATGDLVRIIKDNVYFIGRKDDVIKRFGTKLNLRILVESVRREFPEISDANCVLHQDELCLFIVTTTTAAKDIVEQLRIFFATRPATNQRPDRIKVVDQLPLSAHGKLCRSIINDWAENDENVIKNARDFLCEQFSKVLGIDLFIGGSDGEITSTSSKSQKTAWNSTFFDCGGSSFMAMQFCKDIETKFGQYFDDLISLLLDRHTTIKTILERVHLMKPRIGEVLEKDQSPLPIKWQINMGKCIDATPTICRLKSVKLICCGSHSHRLAIVRCEDGAVWGQIPLPDRIESQVS